MNDNDDHKHPLLFWKKKRDDGSIQRENQRNMRKKKPKKCRWIVKA